MQPEGIPKDVTLTRGVQAASAPLPVSEGTFGEHNAPYEAVSGDVSKNIDAARDSAAPWVNAAYWLTGRRRVEFEQSRKERAEYRTALVERLSVDWTTRFGRGFYRQNAQYMRLFYLSYPPSQIRQTPSGISEAASVQVGLEVLLAPLQIPRSWSAHVRLPDKVVAAECRITLPDETVVAAELDRTRPAIGRR